MPVKYTIGDKRITVIGHGTITVAELEKLFGQIDNDPGFVQGMSILVLSRGASFDISTTEAFHMTQIMRSLRHRFVKFAVVVEKNLHYGFGRMIQAYYENRDVTFKIFKERQEAEQWLKETYPENEGLEPEETERDL